MGTDFGCDGGLIPSVATALRARGRVKGVDGGATDILLAFGGNNTAGPIDLAPSCPARGGGGRMDFETEAFVAHALRGEGGAPCEGCEPGAGFDASEGNVLTRQFGESLLMFLWISGKVSTESRPMDVVTLDEVRGMALEQIEGARANR